MASHRHDRLTEDIRRELTDIFRMLKDPRITGMISIVKVDLSGDQSYCKVYISSLECRWIYPPGDRQPAQDAPDPGIPLHQR